MKSKVSLIADAELSDEELAEFIREVYLDKRLAFSIALSAASPTYSHESLQSPPHSGHAPGPDSLPLG